MQVGIGKLQDGSQKVTVGLNTLNSKTGEMQVGIEITRWISESNSRFEYVKWKNG